MNRRTILGMMGAAALPPFVLGAGVARAGLELDPANPDHVLLMLRKLAHSVGNEPIFWWIRTTRHGLVDSAFTPLWGQNGGAIFATRDVDDQGSYEISVIVINFTINPETGQPIETFKNPYTKKEMELQTFGGTDPIRVVYKSGGNTLGSGRGAPPGYKITASGVSVGPAVIEGDDVWVRTDNVFRMEPNLPDNGRLRQVNDWSTYRGSLKDVASPDLESAPATWAFNDINTWPSWMGMEDRPGNYMGRGAGRKVFSIDDMPSSWRRLMAERHPDILNDPLGALTG